MLFQKQVDGELWSCAYDAAIRPDNSLLFPKKLSHEYLARQRKIQGSYIFAHQYLNQIIPADDMDFKKEWLKYYSSLPQKAYTFACIDPAISLDEAACYTAFAIVDVDVDNMWYLKAARRVRITATQTVKLIFDIQRLYQCQVIGVESVAYQAALIDFLRDEMRKRQVNLPLYEIKRGPDKSKNTRIRALVPRFEWQGILVKQGLTEFEDEYFKFPRGSFVDIMDALASIGEIAFPPSKEKEIEREPSPNSPHYEQWFIRKRLAETKGQAQDQ